MKHFLRLLTCWLVLSAAVAYGQTTTTVTGHIQDVTGVPANGGYVEFRIQPVLNSTTYYVSGAHVIAPLTSRCAINSSGDVVAAVGVGACTVWGNSAITPVNTCYVIATFPNGAPRPLLSPLQQITGTTYDLSTPVSCPTANAKAQDTMTVQVPPFASNIVPSLDKRFSLGTASSYYSAAYIDQAFINSLNAPLNSMTAKNINSVRFCAQFTGGDAGVKYTNCEADLASQGGQLNGVALDGAQSISANITLSVPSHIILGSGTYSMTNTTGPTFTMAPSSIIEGQGIGATTIRLTVNGANADGVTPAAHTILRNLTIAGNTTFSSGATGVDGCDCTDVTLENVEIKNFGGHGINLGSGGSSNWKIINSYIHDNHDDGILLGATTTGNLIAHNRIENNGSNGVDVNGTDNRIEDNDIIGNGGQYSAGSFDCYGVLIDSNGATPNGDDNIIEGNRIRNNKCQQVNIRADASGHANHTIVKGNIISSNVAAGAAGVGINIDTSVGAGCGTVSHTQIEGNTIYGNSSYGILGGGGAGAPCVVDYTTIHNNTIVGNGNIGIFTTRGDHYKITDNFSVSNTGGDISNSGATHIEDSGNFTTGADGGSYISSRLGLGLRTGAYGMLDLASGATGLDGVFFGDRTNGWLLTEKGDASTCFRITSTGTPNTNDRLCIQNAGEVDTPLGLNIGAGTAILQYKSATASLTFNGGAALAANQCYDSATGVAVIGFAPGDNIVIGPPNSTPNIGLTYTYYANGANNIQLRVCNSTAAPIANPGAQTWRAGYIHQ